MKKLLKKLTTFGQSHDELLNQKNDIKDCGISVVKQPEITESHRGLSPSHTEQLDKTIAYSEYLSEQLDKTITYSEYVAEKINETIDYSEYVAEKINEIKKQKPVVHRNGRIYSSKNWNSNYHSLLE